MPSAANGEVNVHRETLILDPGEESGCIQPDILDIMLSDIDNTELHTTVAEKLGVVYLSSASANDARFPVRGVIFGRMKRVVVSLVVSRRATRRAVNVIFVVNTGSPYTFCSPAVFSELGVTDTLPKALELSVHGVEVNVSPSTFLRGWGDEGGMRVG